MWRVFKLVALVAYVVLSAVLAAATFIEWRLGTPFVTSHVYGSWWFVVLMTAVVVPGVVVAIRFLGKNRPAILLHAALALVALGALLTRVTGAEGVLHLREGQGPQSLFLSSEDGHPLLPLPVPMVLDSFRIVYYPHTDAPMDYVSYLRADSVHHTVSMNRVLSLRGYRFYQSSYDPDARGTILTVNHDPYGMTVSYAGYILVVLAFILVLANPNGRFRRLLRNSPKILFLPLLALPLSSCSHADAPDAPLPTDAQLNKFSKLDVIYRDRPAPIDTYCADFALKVTGRTSWHGVSANALVLSWMTVPEKWQFVPMIKVKNPDAAAAMGLSIVDGHLSAASLFAPDGHYLLTPYLQKSDKTALDINDRLQAIVSLTDGSAFRLSPSPIPSFRRKLEVLYVRLQPVAFLFKFQLTLGLVALVLAVWMGEGGGGSRTWTPFVLSAIAILSVVFQSVSLIARGVIARAWPLSNGYETMLFLALSLSIVALLLRRRQSLLSASCLLMSGFALLVAHIAISNPHITPLMPVLHSPWLSIHVASVMVAYSLFTIIMLNGVIALAMRRAEQSLRVSILLLYVAVALLTLGIFVGAVWAGESWGRYWGWDPKEVWALITLFVYVVPLHPSLVPVLRNPHAAHIYLIAAFVTVLMTYFGVNYLLGGMHSYA